MYSLKFFVCNSYGKSKGIILPPPKKKLIQTYTSWWYLPNISFSIKNKRKKNYGNYITYYTNLDDNQPKVSRNNIMTRKWPTLGIFGEWSEQLLAYLVHRFIQSGQDDHMTEILVFNNVFDYSRSYIKCCIYLLELFI